MTIGVKTISDSTFTGRRYIDFEIYVDGVTDQILYRQYDGESKFTKIFGFPKQFGKAIRGKQRTTVQQLVNEMMKTKQSFAIAII